MIPKKIDIKASANILFFLSGLCSVLVSHHQCRSNQLRQTGREKVSLPVSGSWSVSELDILQENFDGECHIDTPIKSNGLLLSPVQGEGLGGVLHKEGLVVLLRFFDNNLGVSVVSGILHSNEDVLFEFCHFLISFLVLTSFP